MCKGIEVAVADLRWLSLQIHSLLFELILYGFERLVGVLVGLDCEHQLIVFSQLVVGGQLLLHDHARLWNDLWFVLEHRLTTRGFIPFVRNVWQSLLVLIRVLDELR